MADMVMLSCVLTELLSSVLTLTSQHAASLV